MLATVITIIGTLATVAGFVFAIHAFRAAPLFSRKRLRYELKLSAPLIHETANSDSSLIVKYGRRVNRKTLKNPHVAQIRLSNIGAKEVRSNDFDQNTAVQLDLGVAIIGLLKVTFTPLDMPDPVISAAGKRVNIGRVLFRLTP